MTRQGIRNVLFRLTLVLKLLTWAAVAVALVTGFRDAAAGRELAPPTTLLYVIGALLAAQFVAFLAWRLARERS